MSNPDFALLRGSEDAGDVLESGNACEEGVQRSMGRRKRGFIAVSAVGLVACVGALGAKSLQPVSPVTRMRQMKGRFLKAFDSFAGHRRGLEEPPVYTHFVVDWLLNQDLMIHLQL